MKIPALQPIRFTDEQTDCLCNSKDSQLVQDGDFTQFQFELDVCDYQEDLITNGDFDDVSGTGWNNSGFAFGGDAITSNGNVSDTIQTDTNVLGVNKAYQLEIDITTCNGEPLLVYMGDNVIKQIVKPGNYQIGGICETNSGANSTLRLVSPKSNTVNIERIACYMVENNFALAVYQVGTNTKIIRTLAYDIADSAYTFFRINRNVVTVTFDWAIIRDGGDGFGLDYGCYYFGITGMCDNPCGQLGFLDGDFDIPLEDVGDNTYPWRNVVNTGTNATSVADGQMTYSSSVINSARRVEDVQAVPCTGKNATYDVTLDIESITKCSVQVTIGGTASAIYTTAGVKQFQLLSAAASSFRIDFLDSPGFNGACTLNSVSANMSTSSPASWEFPFQSNVFDFKEIHPCTMLIAATNNEDAYGLKFGSAFYTPRVRVKGRLRAAAPESSSEKHINELGQEITSYFESRNKEELQLENIPLYLVKWFSLFEGFNKIWVDTVEKSVSDQPELSYNRFCDNAKVGIEIGDYRQDIESVNRDGQLAVTDYENILVRLNDEQEPLIWLDGEERAING